MGTRVAGAVVRRRFTVTGVVQGVGFRPFVHRIAAELALSGFVGNAAGEVFVEVQGDADAVAEFADRLVMQAPPLARIAAVVESARPLGGADGFAIVPSRAGAGVTPIPPDVALCADCLRELFDPADRRYRHPFITCTNCGPRFTIITGLPYDRPATTMAGFPMCAACAGEYSDPADRRFHAQPVCCPDCGPTLTFRPLAVQDRHFAEAVDASQTPRRLPGRECACCTCRRSRRSSTTSSATCVCRWPASRARPKSAARACACRA